MEMRKKFFARPTLMTTWATETQLGAATECG
jgi:hypothetical protein